VALLNKHNLGKQNGVTAAVINVNAVVLGAG
jgi:hypothetical protein